MANDVYQLVIRGTCGGEFWETVQHYQANASMSSDPVTVSDNLITSWIATVQSAFTQLLAEDNFVLGYAAKRVNNGGSPTVMRPITPAMGATPGLSASSALAYLIVQEYITGGKFRTGRWFIPGIPEDNLVSNGYTGPAIADAGTLVLANASVTNGGTTWVWGTWSRTLTTFFLPTYAHLSAKIGVQRRRLLPV